MDSCVYIMPTLAVCSEYNTGFITTQTGDFIIKVFMNGRYYTFTQTYNSGDPIIFPPYIFNPHSVITVEIINPDNTEYELTYPDLTVLDGVTKILIKTILTREIPPIDPLPSP